MSGQDAELDLFRNQVNCAALLEQASPAWQLDKRGSTRQALKYRRGEGEILIINHSGRGWWDPQSSAKGDVFDLVRHLDPGLNFGQVRLTLRRFVGVVPTFSAALVEQKTQVVELPVAERWDRRPRLRPGTPGWSYLAGTRGIPAGILKEAVKQDAIRDGAYNSAWFAHRQGDSVTHVEARGPDYKGSLRGGSKTLFRFSRVGKGVLRLALTEAPIDALSLAAIEGMRADTIYLATGGGMGSGTIQALEAELAAISASPNALLASAADANKAGEKYAAQHAELAAKAGVRFARLAPDAGGDWNDMLKLGRRA